jgi:sulfofructose kinase
MAVEEAMAFASAAAALKCAKPAGRGGIPTLDEITAFQRTTT